MKTIPTAYNGNPLLKGAGSEIEFTPWQIEEYIKCAESCEYFCKNYVKIVSLDHGLIDFEPYKFQNNIIKSAQANRRLIIRQPRQSGKTTIVAGILLWNALFNEHYTIAICANKASSAKEVLSRIKLAYTHLPKWMQQGIVKWNEGDIVLENGTEILTYATSRDACRGKSVNLLYLDEFAFVPRNAQAEFYESVYPTISSSKKSKIIITSTPKGMEMFYKFWTGAVDEENPNGYERIDVHWSEVPGRDANWKIETINAIGEESFRQEFECEFIGSSDTLISSSTLKTLAHINPIEKDEYTNIYKHEEDNKIYAIVVDCGRGLHGDYSAFTVIDITQVPYEVVCTYRNNEISPMLYPNVIFRMANKYNEALVLVEVNDIGEQVATILYNDLQYEGMITTYPRGRKGVTIGQGYNAKTTIGIRTTAPVKRIGCATLKTLIEDGKIVLNDKMILHELLNFVAQGVTYAAEIGEHDDLVMCLVLFSWMTGQEYFKQIVEHDIRELIYKDNKNYIQEKLLPIVTPHDSVLELEHIDDVFNSIMDMSFLDADDDPEFWH